MPTARKSQHKKSPKAQKNNTTPATESNIDEKLAKKNPKEKPPLPRNSGNSKNLNQRKSRFILLRLGNAFKKQYHHIWVLFGSMALVSAVLYQHRNTALGLFQDVLELPKKYFVRDYSWVDGWSTGVNGIDRKSNLSVEEFRQVYDGKRPVLITDVLQDWGAMNWTTHFFLSHYSKQRVVMKAVEGTLDNAEGYALPLEMFIEHMADSTPRSWTYIEDELLIPHTATLRKDIGSTPYLEENFFKLFPREIRPWDAMFLWGTKYSRSSLHIDPYNWTGTNAVIKGMKKWKLYPPGQDEYLYVIPNRMSGFPLKSFKYNSPVDAFEPNLDKYPNFAKARAVEFTQYPGEFLIIPTGWFHQAYNAKETLAVSGQVMNTANYRMVLKEIIKAGNLDMHLLPEDFDHITPTEQVEAAVASIPQLILDKGRKVTQDALYEIEYPSHEHT